MEMEIKTLRIKKIYFDAIASGEKTVEYRAVKPYYAWLGSVKTPFLLRLHYQQPHTLLKLVVKVELVKRPKWVNAAFVPTKKCWALHLA